jgi:hypothetical protein
MKQPVGSCNFRIDSQDLNKVQIQYNEYVYADADAYQPNQNLLHSTPNGKIKNILIN